jgi:division protein CdvB (Snf7/Vps24/ESCRT-III family)
MIELCLVTALKGKTHSVVYYGVDFAKFDEALKKVMADPTVDEVRAYQHLPAVMVRSPKAECAALKAAAEDPQTKIANEQAAAALAKMKEEEKARAEAQAKADAEAKAPKIPVLNKL